MAEINPYLRLNADGTVAITGEAAEQVRALIREVLETSDNPVLLWLSRGLNSQDQVPSGTSNLTIRDVTNGDG